MSGDSDPAAEYSQAMLESVREATSVATEKMAALDLEIAKDLKELQKIINSTK